MDKAFDLFAFDFTFFSSIKWDLIPFLKRIQVLRYEITSYKRKVTNASAKKKNLLFNNLLSLWDTNWIRFYNNKGYTVPSLIKIVLSWGQEPQWFILIWKH